MVLVVERKRAIENRVSGCYGRSGWLEEPYNHRIDAALMSTWITLSTMITSHALKYVGTSKGMPVVEHSSHGEWKPPNVLRAHTTYFATRYRSTTVCVTPMTKSAMGEWVRRRNGTV